MSEFHLSMIHPEFEALIQKIMATLSAQELADLRKDFHIRLRITLTHPDSNQLVEDLWDFFYDWCVFERQLPNEVKLEGNEKEIWDKIRDKNLRGLFTIGKVTDTEMKLKDLYTGKSLVVRPKNKKDMIGLSAGDILEGRLVNEEGEGKTEILSLARRPSYHSQEVHAYLKKKVKQFKKAKDTLTYQSWLWLVVGMYLKHRIYSHMPIEKIYDDNSRI